MCLAVPRRVLQIEAGRVLVDWESGPLWASSAAFPDLTVGEYVLVHAGLVLERVSAEEAETLLAMQAELAADDFGLPSTPMGGDAPR
ncbi:MAG: HypC/HybG/HupF family hydrogenase formation chaperone [Chloroflexi bacterium]|nr:HypC/HybG/HupF family hydrogenase formation chaperone [Chloroflexota bacterium]